MTRKNLNLVFLFWIVWTRAVFGEELAQPSWDDVDLIFQKRCINCHSEHGAAKGLRLDSYEAAIAGGENGAVVEVGNAAKSELIRRLRGESTPRMPFLSTPLPQEEINFIVRWVNSGLSKAEVTD